MWRNYKLMLRYHIPVECHLIGVVAEQTRGYTTQRVAGMLGAKIIIDWFSNRRFALDIKWYYFFSRRTEFSFCIPRCSWLYMYAILWRWLFHWLIPFGIHVNLLGWGLYPQFIAYQCSIRLLLTSNLAYATFNIFGTVMSESPVTNTIGCWMKGNNFM